MKENISAAVRHFFGSIHWLFIAVAMIAIAVSVVYVTGFLRDGYRTASSPVTVVKDTMRSVLGEGDRDVKVEGMSVSEQTQKAVQDLALIAAFDSKGEVASLRPRVMEEMMRVVMRIKEAHPDLTVSLILEGAVTWLPEGWDPRKETYTIWRDRERDRMLKGTTQSIMDVALKSASRIYYEKPVPGPIRYVRPNHGVMSYLDGETKAAAHMKKTMDVDTNLAKLGISTIFYRLRGK